MILGHPNQVFLHPALPGLSMLSASFSGYTFPRHIHDNCTMGVTVSGVNRTWHRGAHHFSTPNTIAVINPGEPHTGGTCTADGFSAVSLTIPDELFIAAQHDAGTRIAAPRYSASIIADPETVRALSRLAQALCSRMAALAIEERWLVLCALLFARHAEGRTDLSPPAATPRQIRTVREVLDATDSDTLSLTELAALAGLSRFQLARGFAKHVGLPPHAYHLQRRIERARAMILAGSGLADVAACTGFSDQAHLTRHFRRHFAVTPGRLRSLAQQL